MTQTAGRGQRSKSWHSPPGENILLSVVINPPMAFRPQPFLLSAAVAVAAAGFLTGLAGVSFQIKWPNDIYFGDKKAGGILIENIYRGKDWLWAVVGVGINLNQVDFDPALPNPVSLKKITGVDYNLDEAVRQLWERLRSFGDNDPMDDYNDLLYGKNSPLKVKFRDEEMQVHCLKVDAGGILHTDRGRFSHGELQFLQSRS